MALDLLATSSLLRGHVAQGKVVLGVNHKMTDFATGRKKVLDLVIARPAGQPMGKLQTFESLARKYDIGLTNEEQGVLDAFPVFPIAPVGAVLVALEAKAAMTSHVKALPRLYDELNSSHLCVHGASKQALAIGYVQVNASESFVSPVINNGPIPPSGPVVSTHNQPRDTLRVIQKVAEIPRRSASSEVGFDGIGVTVMDFKNDGGYVEIVEAPPAPQPGEQFHYSNMIVRMANEYDTVFSRI
ncbi:hypothetical protein [Micromonospora sp. SL4-19]|uniref:hypothetical protein n=1 Tax=Micromonospora sp. SL4-19 TaxID=3399129 RepID=UPI003A4E5BB4